MTGLGLGLTMRQRRPIVQPGVLWISPTGSDDTGDSSEGNPLLNLQTAINWANPGDTIMVKDGVYTPSGLTNVYEGKDGLLIKAAPGASPVFDAINHPTPDDYNTRVMRVENVRGVTIVGLGFTRGPDGGLHITGTSRNINIVNCWSYTNGRAALFEGSGFEVADSATSVLFLNCDSYNNYNAVGGSAGYDADGFHISTTGTVVCYGCRAWRNTDDGFDLFNGSFDEDVTMGGHRLIKCWAWENGYLANGDLSVGDGMGFKMGGQRESLGNGSGGNFAIDCLAWRNKVNGFTDNQSTIPNTMLNNTAYDNGSHNFESGVVAHTLINNLAFDAGSSDVNITNDTLISNNSWDIGGITVSAADWVSVDDTAARGARDGGALPDADFLVLALGSDLIQKGIPVGLPYKGSAPNLGWGKAPR